MGRWHIGRVWRLCLGLSRYCQICVKYIPFTWPPMPLTLMQILVRFALRRVGLEDFFVDIFTSKKLLASKLNPLFYQSVVHTCGFSADEVVMVGDGYRADVLGARQAGFHTIWYNPSAIPCPISQPIHDAEIQAMSEMPAAMRELVLREYKYLNTANKA
jgi:beta-phosphoglucomutase-like phosphatase (HAD superfamily)